MFLNIRELAKALRVSQSTIHRWRLDGKFPQPIRLSPGACVWSIASVEAFLQTKSPGETFDLRSAVGTEPRRREPAPAVRP